MRKILWLLPLLLAGPSNAISMYGMRNEVPSTAIPAYSSATLVFVSVSTFPETVATRMDVIPMPDRAVLTVNNVDSSIIIWCGFNNAVAGNTGIKIAAGGMFSIGLGAGIPFYCRAQGAGAAVTTVLQSK